MMTTLLEVVTDKFKGNKAMIDPNEREHTIQGIIRQGLCIGCGTCVALCPKSALMIHECQETGTYLPLLDDTKCNQCGSCLKVCPAIEPDFSIFNLAVFGQKPEFPMVGNYFKCYSGHATDKKRRFKSTSGGLVSALAAFAMEEGIADGVLTTRAKVEQPLRPQSFIARTKEEVMSAVGSKYCPVSANIAFGEILKDEDRYIVVGLPCHIQGLRKAQAISKKLKNRIYFVFGLVCNHTPTFHATDFLLKKFKIPSDRIVNLDYRTSGWPGYMKIIMKDRSECFIPFSSPYYWGYVFQKFFWPKRCVVCNDKLCQLADIVFMDAWLPEFSSDQTGVSLIIVRSKKAEKFISKAIESGVVKLQPIAIEDVLRSQQILKIVRRAAITRFALKYPPKKFHALNAKRIAITPSILNLYDAFYLIFVNRFCTNSSKLSRLIIEFHMKLWDFVRSAKRLITKE